MSTGKSKAADELNALPTLAPNEMPSGNNLDKVRDILFGAQVRESDRRFARMEERLVKECDDLRAEVRKRLDSLEAYLKAEFETLTDRLKSEETNRAEAVGEVAREVRDVNKNLDRKITQLDDLMLKGQRDIRQQLMEQSNRLSEDMQRNQTNAAAQLERVSTHLESDKTSNAALASMFMEVSMRLNNEFHLPSTE